MARPKLSSIRVFSYQVGFGDCFLLRLGYSDRNRYLLIDFGSTGMPEELSSGQMLRVATDIAGKCGGDGLEAVIATHRHADHISGFATNAAGTGPGNVIRDLKPKLVLQPWTEQPDLPPDARAATGTTSVGTQGLRPMRMALQHMHDLSQQVVNLLAAKPGSFEPHIAAQLEFLGDDNLSNRSAVENLASMAPRRVYACHGSPSGLETLLPGVKVHVLGPPTLEQTDSIRKQKSSDPAEFWQLRLQRLADDQRAATASTPLFPDHVAAKGGKLPMSARWLAWRMQQNRGEQMLQIVRSLDKQLNNTSLILLFEIDGRKLLFPGDAQIENWAYALSKPRTRKLLADVDLYKAGHHGSRNATPRSMWAMLEKKGPASKADRLTTIMSTMPGKHGQESAKTEVPRKTLEKEFASQSHLHSTHQLPPGQLYEEVVLFDAG